MTTRILAAICMLSLSAGCALVDSGTDKTANAAKQRQRSSSKTGSEQAISVKAHRAGIRPISMYVIANTTLEAIRNVTIYAKLNALVSKLHVEEGRAVKEGQLVAELDEREIRVEHNQALIAVQQAKTAKSQAEVKAQLAAANFERAKTLFEQKLTSQQEFDQAALANRTDDLGFKNASQQLETAESRLQAASLQLAYARIESPIRGVITERMIDVGDRVNVNERMFTVQEYPPLWSRIHVPERALSQLKLGQEAQVEFEANKGNRFTAKIILISPTVDVASGTVKVTIQIDRPGSLLRPGMFGTVYIATETHEGAVAIPKKAVLRERDLSYVFLIKPDHTVAKQEVKVGFTEEAWVEILEGIKVDDSVVTVGFETLNDGYLVAVQDWEYTTEPVRELESVPPELLAQAQEGGGPAAKGGAGQKSAGSGGEGQPGGGIEGGQKGAGFGGGQKGGGFNSAQMFERMMQNPQIKAAYEAKLKEDPALATDDEKRREFFREVRSKLGISRKQ